MPIYSLDAPTTEQSTRDPIMEAARNFMRSPTYSRAFMGNLQGAIGEATRQPNSPGGFGAPELGFGPGPGPGPGPDLGLAPGPSSGPSEFTPSFTGSMPGDFTPLPYSGAIQGTDPALTSLIPQAWGYVAEPGSVINVTTGVSGHSPINHQPGHAWDYNVTRPDGSTYSWNDPETLLAAEIFAAMGGHGVGAGRGYMGGNHFHFDVSANGPRSWSDSGANQDYLGFGHGDYAARIAAARQMELEDLLRARGILR